MKVEPLVSTAWREFDSPRVHNKNIPLNRGVFVLVEQRNWGCSGQLDGKSGGRR
jgi:hypothetical protein